MVMCFVPDCKHYSDSAKKTCKFFKMPTNPKEKKRWISLMKYPRRRQDRQPSRFSQVCSCHFVNELRKNGPTLVEFNKKKKLNFPDPEKRTRTRKVNNVANKSEAISNALNSNSKMPSYCAVVGCKSNAAKNKSISFFRFPSATATNRQICPLRKERRDKWIAALHRKDLDSEKIKYNRICSRHFHSGKPAALEDKSNPDWVPSVNMGYFKNNKNKFLTKKNQAKVKLEEITTEASIPPNNQELVEAEAETNKIITVSDDLCRICFENKSNMTPFSSVVCINDAETLILTECFQHLTGESDEQLNNPQYPNKICDSCINLLTSAYKFKKKYDKTSKILNEIINSKTDEDNYSLDSDATLSAVQDEDGSFVEMNINDDDDELLEILNDENDDTDDIFYKKLNNINETLDLLNGKSEATNEKLYKCPICQKQYTKYQLKDHSRNHEELSSYIDRAPIYNKTLQFYVRPSKIKKVANGKCNLIRHTCHLCKESFYAADFFKHMILHGFYMMD